MSSYPSPVFRKIRAYAFDPSLSLSIDTSSFNIVTYKIPWDENLKPGPVCEYLEVIDFDPTIEYEKDKFGVFYNPVNLNHPHVLATDGLDPSDSNPEFHQQMVYTVAMKTIKNFESALGRKVIWREHDYIGYSIQEQYVGKLKIYPHALREPNAYYSPVKKALLFGYFKSTPSEKNIHMPGTWVFTCLSHDIIAHEVTHAILDGLNLYYNEPTNPDVWAFHEAFADIIALFQHFTVPEVLYSQINKTNGDLESQNLLGQLAQEFGGAIGGYSSLRDAIGYFDESEKKWKRKEPKVSEYENIMEPHERGSLLVAAVFEVFLTIYKLRVSDLVRIATNGSGILPEGNLHPDLVSRMSYEASKTASHILSICIRAIDYCPPVDITYGEFLRGLITADYDLVNDDKINYRLAFIDAFKRRGIYPEGIKTLSVESLRYPPLDTNHKLFNLIANELKKYTKKMRFVAKRDQIFIETKRFIQGSEKPKREGLHEILYNIIKSNLNDFEEITGLCMSEKHTDFGINSDGTMPRFRIDNLREISRVGPDGKQVNQVKFSVIQTARLIFLSDNKYKAGKEGEEYMRFRGGVNFIFDIDTGRIKYIIAKPLMSSTQKGKLDENRLFRQYNYFYNTESNGLSNFEKEFGISRNSDFQEPFALLHNH